MISNELEITGDLNVANMSTNDFKTILMIFSKEIKSLYISTK